MEFKVKDRPSRVYSYKTEFNKLNRLGQIQHCIDFACGTMSFLDRIETPPMNYTGVEVLQDRIDEGLRKNPNANAICGRIQDAEISKRGDLVVCHETVGINSWFEANETIEVVEKLINSTAEGGTLSFNIGPYSKKYYKTVKSMLQENFEDVEINVYGRWHKLLYWPFYVILSYVLLFIPKIGQHTKNQWIFFHCKTKK